MCSPVSRPDALLRGSSWCPAVAATGERHRIADGFRFLRHGWPVAVLLALAGCSTPPRVYQQLGSAAELSLHPTSDSEKPFLYRAPDFDPSRYRSVLLDPVVIYGNYDAEFAGVSAEDRRIIADYMDEQFSHVLAKSHSLISAPGPDALRIHVTLTGIEKSTPVLSTLSHVTPSGVAVNGIKSILGVHGTAFGAVTYAIEISNAATDRLLMAYIANESADALDVTASLGYLDAARAGVRRGARDLRATLAPQADRSQD